MIKGKTSSGFEYEIDEEKLDDMRLLDMIADIAEGDITKISQLTRKVLGDKQREGLYKHLEETEGRPSIKKVCNEITEIFSAGNAGKNS